MSDSFQFDCWALWFLNGQEFSPVFMLSAHLDLLVLATWLSSLRTFPISNVFCFSLMSSEFVFFVDFYLVSVENDAAL